MMHVLTRQEISKKKSSEFADGDCVKVGKYLIWIRYGQFSRPSLLTTVSTIEDFRDMTMRKWPVYIANFISCYND